MQGDGSAWPPAKRGRHCQADGQKPFHVAGAASRRRRPSRSGQLKKGSLVHSWPSTGTTSVWPESDDGAVPFPRRSWRRGWPWFPSMSSDNDHGGAELRQKGRSYRRPSPGFRPTIWWERREIRKDTVVSASVRHGPLTVVSDPDPFSRLKRCGPGRQHGQGNQRKARPGVGRAGRICPALQGPGRPGQRARRSCYSGRPYSALASICLALPAYAVDGDVRGSISSGDVALQIDVQQSVDQVRHPSPRRGRRAGSVARMKREAMPR